MVAVKQRELTLARDLYMQAYEKVRDQPTLEVLQGQVGLLNAAEALEKRAERIQEWPFDDATFARVVTIASSAVATIIARFLLDPIGLSGSPATAHAHRGGPTRSWRNHGEALRSRHRGGAPARFAPIAGGHP